MGDLFHEALRLRAETEKVRLDYIRTDLDVCLALADVAETRYSIGHREEAARSMATAEKGYSDMLHFFSQARGVAPEVQEELQSKFKQLRERLDQLRRLA